MTVDQVFIIKKLQNLDEMLVAYSAVTRMPFAICDDESFNDQVWIFTDQDKLKTFAEKYKEEKKLILPVKVQKKDASMFYMNLFAMGINEVVFCDGDQENKIELTKIVRMPDVDALPENRKPILNPQLQLSAAYFLQELRKPGVEPDREALKDLEEEMSANLARSTYLMPVDVEKDEEGKENVRLLYVQNKKGERYQPIFSDTGELVKHYRGKEVQNRLIQVRFDQLSRYMIKDVQGYVLNPEGINLILRTQQIELLNSYYNGKKVSVQGSGMGIPSMGIYSYELFNTFGVDQIIRVGTCGAVNRDVEVGSLILAMGCCSNSNFASQYHLPGIFAPLADYGLLESAVNQARILEAPFYVGNVYSSDVFYEDLAGEKGQWEKMGVLAQEMETMSLYCTAARAGKKALTMLTVGSSIHSSKALTNEEREKNLDTMIRCALEVA